MVAIINGQFLKYKVVVELKSRENNIGPIFSIFRTERQGTQYLLYVHVLNASHWNLESGSSRICTWLASRGRILEHCQKAGFFPNDLQQWIKRHLLFPGDNNCSCRVESKADLACAVELYEKGGSAVIS